MQGDQWKHVTLQTVVLFQTFFLQPPSLVVLHPKQYPESQGKPAILLLADLSPVSLCRGTSGSR